MGINETTATSIDTGISWQRGVLAGLAGGLAMTALMLAMGATPVIAGAIPGLYGLALPPNLLAGIVVHLSHGAVLGVVLAGLVSAIDLDAAAAIVSTGVVYGVVTWLLLAALVMPLWLSAVGFAMAPPFPNFAPPSLLWHVTYGAVAGAVLAGVEL
ncbi:histidine kinase [Halosegnis sp.]|uniref:histidine kinase n=1 Tax=Halosegnis sp. TaxID=2864959 RepID=UPI0035D3F280